MKVQYEKLGSIQKLIYLSTHMDLKSEPEAFCCSPPRFEVQTLDAQMRGQHDEAQSPYIAESGSIVAPWKPPGFGLINQLIKGKSLTRFLSDL